MPKFQPTSGAKLREKAYYPVARLLSRVEAYQLKTYAMALDLIDAPEIIEEYKEHHRQVWPEVKQGLEEIGILEMKIFLTGCRLFMFQRTEDEYGLE